MKVVAKIAVAAIACVCACAQASTVTAVCIGPTGFNTVYRDGAFETDKDGFGNGRLTYVWVRGDTKATVYSISGERAGSTPNQASALVVEHKGFISMSSAFGRELWTHALHTPENVVMITRQIKSASGLPTVSTFSAQCQVTEK